VVLQQFVIVIRGTYVLQKSLNKSEMAKWPKRAIHAPFLLYCCLASFNHCQLGFHQAHTNLPNIWGFSIPWESHKVKGNLKIDYLFYFWSSINHYLALNAYPQSGGRQNNIGINFNKFSDTVYTTCMYFEPPKDSCHMSRDIVLAVGTRTRVLSSNTRHLEGADWIYLSCGLIRRWEFYFIQQKQSCKYA